MRDKSMKTLEEMLILDNVWSKSESLEKIIQET